jgi:uncharacterized membrane protein
MIRSLKQAAANLRESLWFLPGLMITLSVALALILVEIDSRVESDWLENYPRLFGLGADGSRGMLTAIAGSMLTVAALAFSLTLNAIMQASAQFTPRILRNFMRDRANQFVLGYFVGVFAFCLLVLRTIRGADELKFVPSLAVMTGLVLALGGILVLIFFIHHIAESLQITKILDNIREETKQAVEKMFPEKLGAAATEEERTEMRHADRVKDWQKVPALGCGYVQSVDSNALVEFAARNNLLIKMRRGIGEFAVRSAALAEIADDAETRNGNCAFDEGKIEEINALFTLDRHRTIEQDVGFGIRQIVDIALKALSPGINDTTTAISCLDSLGEILSEIARRKIPARVRAKDGIARAIVVAPSFADYVETAFDQIRISGEGNQAVFERLLETIQFVAECTTDKNRRAVLRKQINLIEEFAAQTLKTDYEKEKVRLRAVETRAFLEN